MGWCAACWMWCSGAVRDMIVSASGAWHLGAGRRPCSYCSVAGVQRREILSDGEGDIVCRGSLYLPCTNVRTEPPVRHPKGRTGPQSFKRIFFPSASPPRARADLISLTHGSLRCWSQRRVPSGHWAGRVHKHRPTAPVLPCSGVTDVSLADPADKPYCALGQGSGAG